MVTKPKIFLRREMFDLYTYWLLFPNGHTRPIGGVSEMSLMAAVHTALDWVRIYREQERESGVRS